MRLLGVRHIVAFAVAAVVGDIARFANPKKLVAYLGLTPSVEDSGETIRGRGQLVSFGRRSARAAGVFLLYKTNIRAKSAVECVRSEFGCGCAVPDCGTIR
jgi:transposase